MVGCEERVEAMYDIAKDENIDLGRAKLRIDVIKWEASKLISHTYGDKLAIDFLSVLRRRGWGPKFFSATFSPHVQPHST